jgi:hypothetical protein
LLLDVESLTVTGMAMLSEFWQSMLEHESQGKFFLLD